MRTVYSRRMNTLTPSQMESIQTACSSIRFLSDAAIAGLESAVSKLPFPILVQFHKANVPWLAPLARAEAIKRNIILTSMSTTPSHLNYTP